MDECDRVARQELVSRDELWEWDTIYPGSCVLNAEGRAERERLARQIRQTDARVPAHDEETDEADLAA